MRANLEAFEKWRIRPRMLTGNAVRDISVEVLGTRSPGPFLLAPVGVLSIAHRGCGGGGRRGIGVVGRADGALERGDPLDRGRRRDECAALVPALLGERPRDLCELRPPGRAGRVRRDRRHARHADPRLAAAGPPPGVPAVHPRRGLRPVLLRPGVPVAARQAAARGSAHRGGDDARDLPEPRLDLERSRLAARADDAAAARQGRAHRRGRTAGARLRAWTASSSRITAAVRSTAPSQRSMRSSRFALPCPRRSC